MEELSVRKAALLEAGYAFQACIDEMIAEQERTRKDSDSATVWTIAAIQIELLQKVETKVSDSLMALINEEEE